MAMLVTGMLLTGCSKDSENNGMETKGNTEQTQTLTKEQIVGVWRNGDYWVSFSEDGFYSAFFYIDDRERIDDGDYTIDGYVITTKNPEHSARITIKTISSSSMNLVMEYTYPNILPQKTVTKEMNFTKTSTLPCKSTDELVGKSFSYDDKSEAHDGKVVTFINHIPHNDRIIRLTYSEPDRFNTKGDLQYYVYLPPLIYHTILSSGVYNPENIVMIGELTESQDGIISYKRIR